MSEKSTEQLNAFHVAKADKSADKRKEAFTKITRKGLLLRLVVEGQFKDMRVAALKKLDAHAHKDSSPEEFKVYLEHALREKDTEIRMLCARRIDLRDRAKLMSSQYADVRQFLAHTTSSQETLLLLLMDSDQKVRQEAEKSLNKKDLRENSRPYSVN
jgi:hypothetical protein